MARTLLSPPFLRYSNNSEWINRGRIIELSENPCIQILTIFHYECTLKSFLPEIAPTTFN